jgi:hypothetical protein
MTPDQVKAARESLGLDRRAFSRALGCEQSACGKFERGQRRVTEATAADIARLLAGEPVVAKPQPNGAGQGAGIAAPGTPRRAHRRTQPVAELSPFPVRKVAIGLGLAITAIVAVTRWAARTGAAAGG